jgi:hypothetical protein
MSLSRHPANLLLRFVLELAALYAMGNYGLHVTSGLLRYALCVALPLTAATVWGVFAVPSDPSRSGRAPVPVPGTSRLALELAFFSVGVLAFMQSDARTAAVGLALSVVLHYALSVDRIRWLLQTS